MASITARNVVCAGRPVARTAHQTLFHLVPSSSSQSATTQVLSGRVNASSRLVVRSGRLAAVAVQATASPEPKAPRGPPGDVSSRDFAVAMAKVADEVKCTDVVVLDVAPVVSWTSFLVIATVFSKPQLMAALSKVEKAAGQEFGRARLNLPGSSPWETLDFGDVVLHLFTAEQREYYDIESFYAAAEEVELPFGQEGQGQEGQGQGQAGQGQAPTWSTRL